MRKDVFANGEIYHAYNRGVEKRPTFLCADDYLRFLESMRIFNTIKTGGRIGALYEAKPCEDEQLVRIVAYCLMPNHFHLVLKQVADDGISRFIQKLATGYTMYFNKCYDRSGVLFQGVFKSKHVPTNEYLLHLSRYVHLNPLDLIPTGSSPEEKRRFLREYRWSSFGEYLSVGDGLADGKAIVLNQFRSPKEYVKFVYDLVGEDRDDFARFRLDKRG